MSNYRDDLVDVMTVQATITNKMTIVLNERVASTDRLGTKNKDTPSDALTIIDAMGDGVGVVMGDMVRVADSIWTKQSSRQLISDSISTIDGVHRIYKDLFSDNISSFDGIRQTLHARLMMVDSLNIADNHHHTIKDKLTDSVGVLSDMGNHRQISDHLFDDVTAKDRLVFVLCEHLTDTLIGRDTATSEQLGNNQLTAVMMVSDDVGEVLIGRLNDVAKASDETWGRLTAKDDLHERAMIAVMDELIHDDGGMAWTMNTVNQAMSQYLPYNVNRLAVINGVLYGECDDGVYQLDGKDETITGVLITDKIDYGENLVKPSYAYTEYKTDGIMTLTVHTTQKGVAQAYTYTMPKEQADEMTNGRFVFGRGLFGRQFAYTLQITAKQALLHDLNVHFETTKRRL